MWSTVFAVFFVIFCVEFLPSEGQEVRFVRFRRRLEVSDLPAHQQWFYQLWPEHKYRMLQNRPKLPGKRYEIVRLADDGLMKRGQNWDENEMKFDSDLNCDIECSYFKCFLAC